MRKLYLDIETIPADDEKRDVLEILHKKTLEKKRKTKKDFEQYMLETSFNGAFGKIICIGYAIDNESTDVLYEDGDEKKMLQKFWQIAKDKDLFIGHNIMDFDLRFIYQRSIILGVEPTRQLNFARYRNNPIYDTDREWMKWASTKIGLEYLAFALGIPTPKEGIDGSQVYAFFKKGKIKDILEYCKRDVDVTRRIYKRMIFDKDEPQNLGNQETVDHTQKLF